MTKQELKQLNNIKRGVISVKKEMSRIYNRLKELAKKKVKGVELAFLELEGLKLDIRQLEYQIKQL